LCSSATWPISRAQDHVPRQLRDFPSPQARLDGQQYDQLVAVRVSGGGGKEEQALYLLIGKYLGLPAGHIKLFVRAYIKFYYNGSKQTRESSGSRT
jgi:hypothetical protein